MRESENEIERQKQEQEQKQRSSATCPAVVCHCTMIDGQKNVLCTDETKPTDRVPEDVPSDTVILDLNGNQLEIIRENDFAGLDFLINLNISYSKVSSIEDKDRFILNNLIRRYRERN